MKRTYYATRPHSVWRSLNYQTLRLHYGLVHVNIDAWGLSIIYIKAVRSDCDLIYYVDEYHDDPINIR